mgnify:CR=1 FL=1
MINKLSYEQIKSSRPDIETHNKSLPFPISVIIENIRSLYNVGSIFRTSDGAHIEQLFITGYTGYPPRKEIDKTALGSVESVKWKHSQDPDPIIKSLKEEGYHIIALEHTDKSVPYIEFEYPSPMCLIVGNEVEGISKETLSKCDSAIEIPMYGIKQSLNVSVAYGIAIYHIIEQLKNQKK